MAQAKVPLRLLVAKHWPFLLIAGGLSAVMLGLTYSQVGVILGADDYARYSFTMSGLMSVSLAIYFYYLQKQDGDKMQDVLDRQHEIIREIKDREKRRKQFWVNVAILHLSGIVEFHVKAKSIFEKLVHDEVTKEQLDNVIIFLRDTSIAIEGAHIPRLDKALSNLAELLDDPSLYHDITLSNYYELKISFKLPLITERNDVYRLNLEPIVISEIRRKIDFIDEFLPTFEKNLERLKHELTDVLPNTPATNDNSLKTPEAVRSSTTNTTKIVGIATVLGSAFAFFAVLAWLGITPYPAKPDLEVDFGVTPRGNIEGDQINTGYRVINGTFQENFIITISNVGTDQARDVNILLEGRPGNGWFDFNLVKMTVGDQTTEYTSGNITLPRILKDERIQLYYVSTLSAPKYDEVVQMGQQPYIYYNVTASNLDEKFHQKYNITIPK